MAKKLIHMTWDDVEAEMSIAGSPVKITQLGRDVVALIASKMDATNRAELTNIELMLKRVLAEIKHEQRRYDKTH